MAQSTLAIGIDPAKAQHQAVAVLYPDELMLDTTVVNDVPDIRALDHRVECLAREHDADIVYGIEDHRRHGRRTVEVLQQHDREVRVVNPAWTNRQKDFYGEDKSDSIDARAVAAVVLRRRTALPDATDRGEMVAALREAGRNLEDLGYQRTKALARLHGHLGDVFPPAYVDFFGKLKSPWALRFFARYPVPQDLEGHDAASLAAELQDLAGGRIGPLHGQSYWERLHDRANQILQATAGVRTLPRTRALGLKAELIRQLCHELLETDSRVKRLEKVVSNDLLPEVDQPLTTIPGIGDVLAATILGEIGDIRRFPGRDAFAKYNGTAPARKSSAGREKHRARRACNHRLKRAFWLAAYAAVRHAEIAQAFYQRCLARGLSKIESMKRLARRISDIVYAMLTRGETYDPNRDTNAPGDQPDVPEAGGKVPSDQKKRSQAQSLAGSRPRHATQRATAAQANCERSLHARAGREADPSPPRSTSDMAASPKRPARSPG